MHYKTEMNVGLAGRFAEIKARKRDGTERLLSSGFDNLILDNGLDKATTENPLLDTCAVGNGTSEPAVSQSSLDSFVAATSGFPTESPSAIFDEENDVYGGLNELQFSFEEGAAAGNLSEIGIGWDGADLFSRELIRDEAGNPTTITVLSDEELVVTYQLFILVSIDPVSWGPVEIAEEDRSGFIQPGELGGSLWEEASFFRVRSGTSTNDYRAAPDEPSSVQSFFSGDNADSVSQTDPEVGDRFVEMSVTWEDSSANFTEGIKGFQWAFSGSAAGIFQCSIDPPIMKTSDDELTMTFRVNFNRGTAPE